MFAFCILLWKKDKAIHAPRVTLLRDLSRQALALQFLGREPPCVNCTASFKPGEISLASWSLGATKKANSYDDIPKKKHNVVHVKFLIQKCWPASPRRMSETFLATATNGQVADFYHAATALASQHSDHASDLRCPHFVRLKNKGGQKRFSEFNGIHLLLLRPLNK